MNKLETCNYVTGFPAAIHTLTEKELRQWRRERAAAFTRFYLRMIRRCPTPGTPTAAPRGRAKNRGRRRGCSGQMGRGR